MADHDGTDVNAERAKSEARDAIGAFEEILGVFPNDAGTLDALAQSYHLVGDPGQECTYLKRLIRVLLGQGDTEGAGSHAGRIERFAKDDPEIRDLLDQLRALGVVEDPDSAGPVLPTPSPAGPGVLLDDRTMITDAEMALAWAMKEADVFTEEEYVGVVKDIEEISGQGTALTLSVLHALQDRSSRKLDPALAFIVHECRRPPAPLEHSELDEETIRCLPPDIMIAQGVAVFEHMGSELLVAAMNPLREGLQERLSQHLGRTCHLFAAHPASFDGWMGRVQEHLRNASPAAPQSE